MIETIDNINTLLGDDLKTTIKSNSHVRIAAAAFSIYAFEALSEELKEIDQFEFLFTQNVFKPSEHVGRICLLYTSPSPRDRTRSRMPSSA